MPPQLVPLVGRDAEMAALGRALDAAADGVAGVVLVTGEAGVGKSRLADDATALARARGFLALNAAASPLHGDLHFGVLVEALRPVVRTVETGARTRLVEGLADLGRLFDGLDLPAPEPLGDVGLERTRLFEAVCRLLERLSRQHPLLLVVDDLHWADVGSLAMLDYLVRGLVDARLLVLITRRGGETSSELDRLLSSLHRHGLLTELRLENLDPPGVATLARALLADEPPTTLTGLLVDRTRGLPLFVRALVTTLVESGRLYRSGGRWVLGQETIDDLPPEVVGLLRNRLDTLAGTDRTVLDTVAVAGGSISHDLIAELGPPEPELLHCVKRLRGHGLLAEQLGDQGVRYEVTHPLLAEVAYDELPAIARRRHHAAIATALGKLEPADSSRLAHHVAAAGAEIDAGTALDVLIAALDRALDRKAGEEAAGHAEAAIGMARGLDRVELLPRLLGQRAEALELAGRTDAAIAAWHEAAESASAQGRAVDAARHLRQLALVEWDAGRTADSQTHIDQATAALPETPLGPVHLSVAETRMRLYARRGLVSELSAEVDTLDRLVAATGSRRALALAQLGRGALCLRSGDHAGTVRAVSEVMRMAREDGSVRLLEDAHRPAVCNAVAWGDHQNARRLAVEARQLARELGAPAIELVDMACAAFVDFLTGDWDRAMRVADEVLALSHRVGMRRGVAAALCSRALVHTRRGQVDEAMACLREARSVYGEGLASDQHLHGIGDVCEAMLLVGRGDHQAALAAARSIPAGGLAVPALYLGVLGAAQVAVGDLGGARTTAALLTGQGPGAPYPAAVAAWVEGLVARAGSELQPALDAFARAADGFAALGMPYDAAVARLDWAELRADNLKPGADGEPAQVAALVAEHLEVLDRLGARPIADRARRLLRRLGTRPAPAPRARPAGQLTAREAEIARLVADGLTNPEIAGRLFISQRTVTTHLQRIYRRLGVTSRTALTRYVIEHLAAPGGNT